MTYQNQEALDFHEEGQAGKLKISATKPLLTEQHLALAYSPGVAAPCLEIEKDPQTAYKYTAKGNFVAVISNGTAVLGLGDLGALASKPVMEGKSVLFKRFADIDSIDLEVDTSDPDEFIAAVRHLGPSWGGINLEDIKAPECFVIEETLKKEMKIPVFHDDQHGTAIVTAAGLINAAELAGKKLEDMKLVVLGAGSAGIACLDLAKKLGVKEALLLDRRGVIYKGRNEGMNEYKERFAIDTDDRTLEDAMKGADAFYGLAGKGAVNQDHVKSMAKNPIVFAMANPDPEILPSEVLEVREDAIVATGRSDFNNQVNNVLGFPYIFRGALDVQATAINEEMKIAAAYAIAELARKQVPEEVTRAYGGKKKTFGPEYIIPSPFDPRLIEVVPAAVAKAAMETKVALNPIEDWEVYRKELKARLNPTANRLSLIYENLTQNPKRLVFAEGENESVIRAALNWRDNGYGSSILVGREEKIDPVFEAIGASKEGIDIRNPEKNYEDNDKYIKNLYARLQRKGYMESDVNRLVKIDRNYFASGILANGEADKMVTGLTRSYNETLKSVIDIFASENERVFGISAILAKTGQTIFMADTAVIPNPTAEEMADFAIQSATFAKKMGHSPRVGFVSYSNFGNSEDADTKKIKEAVKILDSSSVDFEYDGEMMASTALNKSQLEIYNFSKLSDTVNIIIAPNLNASHIAVKMLSALGGAEVIGPVLLGLDEGVEILPMGASVSDILTVTALSAIKS